MDRVPSKSERWIVLGAGVGVMLTVGAAFSWSVYTHPLMAFFGWSSFSVSLAFALFVLFYGAGAIAGGFLHDLFGPRRAVMIGAVAWGISNIATGLGMSHFGLGWIYLMYGAVGGAACGMMYVVPGATSAKWFPEERGLANGIVLCGFGLGALVFNLVAGAFPAFARLTNLSAHIVKSHYRGHPVNLPQSAIDASRGVIEAAFVWPGAVYLIVGVLCALVLHQPPRGFVVAKAAAQLAHERDFSPSQMLRTPAFYLTWLMLFVNATCGLALFSNAVPIFADIAGVNAITATFAFGAVSSANGIGRLGWAWGSDFVGRERSLAICFFLQALALFWLAHAHGTLAASAAITVVLLCFGGIFAITPAVMADFFGTKYFGEDYSFIITAAAVAGLVGPLLVPRLAEAYGSLTAWLTPAAIALLLTTLIPIFTRAPKARDA